MNYKVIVLVLLFRITSCNSQDSNVCTKYFMSIINGNPLTSFWAMQMFDASAKLPSGILNLNLVDLGSFDECINIKGKLEETEIKGKYCIVQALLNQALFNPEQNQTETGRAMITLQHGLGLSLGWCIPNVCKIQEFTSLMTNILNKTNIIQNITPLISEKASCQTEDTINEEWDAADWVLVAFLILFGVIMVASTVYDVYLYYSKKETAHMLLLAFSVKSNGKKLLSVSHKKEQLLCLHGIRFLSMAWVILGHAFTAFAMQPLVNLKTVLDWKVAASSMYLLGATVSVDTFFMLSGLLVCYMYLLAKEKGVKFNIILFYVHRYIRLTPALAILVWIHATIIRHISSGPYWKMTLVTLRNYCKDHWWPTLLYIQNYVNNEEMCMGQTWYLSVDTQLFILAPILLIPLWKYAKPTMGVSAVLVFGSCVSSFLVTWFYKLPGLSANDTSNGDYMTKYYYQIYTRFGPWLIGFMLAYVIFKHKRRENPVKMHPIVAISGWILSLTILGAIIYGPHTLLSSYTITETSFFNALHRQCWAIALCWVIYACVFGYGGPIDSFLSWSVFQVLGRFTYTMYLVHLSIQTIRMGSSRSNDFFSEARAFHTFWGDLAYSLFFAIVLTLSFESPMLIIEKVLFKSDKKKPKPQLPLHNAEHRSGRENGSNDGQVNKSFVSD